MEGYKYFVEAISAIALLIAIIVVLRNCFNNTQKSTGPLKIERVVFHDKTSESRYIIVIKNSKADPVHIKSVSAYSKASFKLGKINKQTLDNASSQPDNLFVNNKIFEISDNGQQNISVIGKPLEKDISRLRFIIETSDGIHQVWCDSILTVYYPSITLLSLKDRGISEPMNIFGTLLESQKMQPTPAIRLQDLAKPRAIIAKE
ncbi:MAG: hypothetical protein V7782_12855 [Psychromonas sp.]